MRPFWCDGAWQSAPRCYLRQGAKVFETYWTTSRGVEYMDNSYRLLDLIVYGRQERFEDSPAGWPHPPKARTQCVPMDVPALSGRTRRQDIRTTWEQARAELCQGERDRLFPSPLRLQNQFYDFARRTPAGQSLRDIMANRF